jgi:hypothetical protein
MVERLGSTAWVLFVAAACARPTPAPQSWPRFPRTVADRDALVEKLTVRTTPPPTDVSPQRVFDEAERLGWATLPSGDRRIAEWIAAREPKWVLYGTFHDSAGQVDAFRHLVGPGGVKGFTHVALEQLQADGRWQVPPADQRGDSAVLSAWLDAGTFETFEALAASHTGHDYTAWKYGYERGLLDVVVAARAQGVTPLPCDAPAALHLTDDRLRELHCLFSVRDAIGPSARVAMLWGQAHIGSQGFRRFLPDKERVLSLYAIGARWSKDSPDGELSQRLVLNDAVLVPLGDDEAALLLPDGRPDRVRTDAYTRPRLKVSAMGPGRLKLGPLVADVSTAAQWLELGAGEYTYVFEATDGLRIVGALDLKGESELTFDPGARETRLVLTSGRPPP